MLPRDEYPERLGFLWAGTWFGMVAIALLFSGRFVVAIPLGVFAVICAYIAFRRNIHG